MTPETVKFGKYLLLERISVGGMAEVFKAKSFGVEGFEKILAIKRILPSMTEDAEFIRMFIDEAKIAGQLNHANICQIYELGRINQSHFIAMEYIWGKDLLQIQNRYRKMNQHLPFGQVCYVSSKVCEGLDYAHRKKDAIARSLNIIHRDVTPQNVLVSYEGEIKVIDFGIAKARNRSAKTAAGVLKGKFGYMSPEQVRGLPLDRRSDIFSLGILLYELCTSSRVFAGETDFATLEKVRNVDILPPSQLNPNIPRALEDIILKALQKNPEDRFQWANELQEALQAFMMTQRPVYTAKLMAAWMRKQFADAIRKERAALDQLIRMEREGRLVPMTPRPVSGARPARRSSASLPPSARPAAAALPNPDEEEATVLDQTSPFSPSAAAGEVDEDAPTTAKQGGPAEMGQAPTAILEEDENPLLHYQQTVMLDEDDPNAPKPLEAILDEPTRSQYPAGGAGGSTPVPAAQPVPSQGFPQAASTTPAVATPTTPTPPPRAMIGDTTSMVTAPPVTRRWVRDLIVAVPVAVVCFALGALLMRLTKKNRKPAPPARGTVVIYVVPKVKASVFVDDKKRAEVAGGGEPAVLGGIDRGQRTIKVTAPGYVAVQFKLDIQPPAVLAKAVNLTRDRKPAMLVLKVRPKGATVKINGKPVPGETLNKPIPLPLDKPAKVEVSKLGYEDFNKVLPPASDRNIPLEVKLQRATQPMVQVESKPAGADVLLEGGKECQTPCRLKGLPFKQKVNITVKKTGYLTDSKTVFFKKRQLAKRLNFDLKPDPKAASRAGGRPPADPREVAEARPDQPREPSEPEAESRPSRRRRRRRRSSRASGRESSRKPPRKTPRPPPRKTGKNCDPRCPYKRKGCLWANSSPRSRVYVDGRNTGRNTPVLGGRALKLKPGYHKVSFVTPNGKRYNYGVRIKACKVSRLVRRLGK